MTLFAVDEAPAKVHGSAIFGPHAPRATAPIYRYSLARWWDASLPRDLFVMCNPSTATKDINDATVTRCTGFSQRFGSGGFVVVNAYGFMATKPAAMWAAQAAGADIVGPENDSWLSAHLMTEKGRVIVAWGAHPKPERVWQVRELIRAAGREPLCLGTTKAGQPRHPLMLRNDTPLVAWDIAERPDE